jgi:hypothetical protein
MEEKRDNQAEINIVILLSTKQGFALFFCVFLFFVFTAKGWRLSPTATAFDQGALMPLRRKAMISGGAA